MYKIKIFNLVRFFFKPLRVIIDFLQNQFTPYFSPMNLGPVASNNWKKLIKSNLEKKSGIIDFGCGTGNFCTIFENNKYLGYDINKNFISIAKKKFLNYEFTSDQKKLINKNYRVLFINGVIHHIDDSAIEKIIKLFLKSFQGSEFLIIEPLPPKSIISLEFLIKCLDLGNYIRSEKEYLEIFKKKFKKIDMSFDKIGWNNIVIIKGKI